MPTEAAAYHVAKSGGGSGDGPVNHTESGGAIGTDQTDLDMDTCKICDEEADGECQGGLCAGCCESNRGTGPFQCCDGQWVSGEWSSEEPAELVSWEDRDEVEEAFTVGHGSTSGVHSREVTAMLRANEMVEREQRGDGNCMFRSLSVAAGKRPEYHEELRR